MSQTTTERFTAPSGEARLAGVRSAVPSSASPDAGTPLTPVVFLHAGVADRRMWAGEIAALAAEGYPAFAYDRRGFGETTYRADEPFSHVDDLTAVLDHLGLASVALVGSSMGGSLALDFTLAHPARVSALVLVAPGVSGAPYEAAEEMPATAMELLERLERADKAGDVETVNALEAHVWLDGPASPEGRVADPALRRLFLDMNGIALRAEEPTAQRQSPDAYERLGEVTVPTLVLWGDLDFPDDQAMCARLVSRLPNAEGTVFPGTAHLPNLEQPDAFRAHLLAFIRGLR